VVIIMY